MIFPSTSATSVAIKTCVVFIRISSKQQKDGVSLDAQTEIIKRWATENNIHILKIFQVIGSGTEMRKHKEFVNMIRYTKILKAGCVAVHTVDRFGRNVIESCSYLNELIRMNINFVSVSENLWVRKTRSPEAHRFVQLMQAADIESTRISERVNAANKYLRERGWEFGRCPIGKKVVFVPVDRTAEGLAPKLIRKFVDCENDSKVISTIKKNLEMSDSDLVILFTNCTFKKEKITEDNIKKVRNAIKRKLKEKIDNMIDDLDMFDFKEPEEREEEEKRKRDDDDVPAGYAGARKRTRHNY